MIRFEDVPSEAKEPAKKAAKAEPKPVAETESANSDGGLPLGDEPAAAPAKKSRGAKKPRKT